MKKIILFSLILCSIVSAEAKVVFMDKKKNPDNELFIDEIGLYRYRRAEDIYKQNCQDSPTDEIKSKCLQTEKVIWERGKTIEEINEQGTLFSGKIKMPISKEKYAYYYVKNGKIGEKIKLVLDQYYFENGALYDIKTEELVNTSIVIGGVKGLSPDGDSPSFIAQQKYENGFPVGDPKLILVK